MIRLLLMSALLLGGMVACDSPRATERNIVDQQQTVYLRAQPIPMYDYSLERDRLTGLYNARMNAVQTYAVWRGMTSQIEGDCPSSGYPIPYGMQLTSPEAREYNHEAVLPQAEPNGLFSNGVTTSATWVFCVTDGEITPVYVEGTVTVYPYPVTVDYTTNKVTKAGDSSVKLAK